MGKFIGPDARIKCHLWKHSQVLSLWQMNMTWRSASKDVSVSPPVGGTVTPRRLRWHGAVLWIIPTFSHLLRHFGSRLCHREFASRPHWCTGVLCMWCSCHLHGSVFLDDQNAFLLGGDLPPVSVQGLGAASVKLKAWKRTSAALNYRWCTMKSAGLFAGSNVSNGRVIFSMVLAWGLNIALPHLLLFFFFKLTWNRFHSLWPAWKDWLCS